jgi:O-antigen/teichoic acid export membrane protein
MELFFIERSLTMTDVGYFSIGVTLGSTVMQPVTMLSSALIPYFSRYYRDRRERTEAVYVVLTKAFALVSFFVGWYVSFNSAFFVTLIFGKEFESASAVTAIIVAASPLAASTAVGSALQMGEGRAPFIAITSSILAVVSVFCFWYVVPAYGIIGAGAVRALLQCTGIAAGTVYIMRAMHYRFPLGVFLFSITIPMFLHAGLNILFPGQTFWMVALKGALAIPLFGLMAWGVRPFTLAEWTMLREALDNQLQWRRRSNDIS